jgi:hypothetical protein
MQFNYFDLSIQNAKFVWYILKSNLKLIYKYMFLMLLSIFGLSFQQQQDFDLLNSKVKAVFLYNFTKYFEWPQKMKSGNFIIQVIGSNPSLNQELSKMANTKQIGNQKLEIKNNPQLENSTQPHIIFLLSEASDRLKEIVSKNKEKGSLIVTEKTGLAKAGSAINFVVMDNKQKFEYSVRNAENAGLKTSAEFKSLAIVIY